MPGFGMSGLGMSGLSRIASRLARNCVEEAAQPLYHVWTIRKEKAGRCRMDSYCALAYLA
jgi:hypothetical protein